MTLNNLTYVYLNEILLNQKWYLLSKNFEIAIIKLDFEITTYKMIYFNHLLQIDTSLRNHLLNISHK